MSSEKIPLGCIFYFGRRRNKKNLGVPLNQAQIASLVKRKIINECELRNLYIRYEYLQLRRTKKISECLEILSDRYGRGTDTISWVVFNKKSKSEEMNETLPRT